MAFSGNIGLVHWTFAPTTGGVESYLVDLSRILANQHFKVTVVTGERSPLHFPAVEFVTSDLLSLDLVKSGKNQGEPYFRELQTFFEATIRRRELSIIHGHNLHHFAPEPALALESLRTELGFAMHNTFHETWPDLLRDSRVYERWDGTYAVSKFVREGCRARIGFEPELLVLGVDVDRFQCARAPFDESTDPVILHPARLLPWKGVDISVRALAILHERGIAARLIVTDTQRIADWDQELDAYRRKVFALVESLGLEGSVEFRHADFNSMPQLYTESDVVVYPTLADEPLGLVPLEAMSCRRPVVGSSCGGIIETILDGKTGYLVEPGDPVSLAQALTTLLSNPDRAREMGEHGRQHVIHNFDIAQHVEALVLRYEASLSSKSDRVPPSPPR